MSDLNPIRHRFVARCSLSTCAVFVGITAASMASAQSGERPKPEEIETLFISDQYTYDDNLFRLSESADLSDPLNAGIVSREDYINRLTVGLGEDLEVGRQVFSVQARAQDVRFADNDHLDHVAGQGMLNWDWLITDALTGNLGAGV